MYDVGLDGWLGERESPLHSRRWACYPGAQTLGPVFVGVQGLGPAANELDGSDDEIEEGAREDPGNAWTPGRLNA